MAYSARLIIIAAVLMLCLPGRAGSHGAAQWIQDGGYRNSGGQYCCGPNDCAEIADSDVAPTAAGYLIKSLGETVPFHEATPSPDGHYWRCAWGGRRRCFFAPPGAV